MVSSISRRIRFRLAKPESIRYLRLRLVYPDDRFRPRKDSGVGTAFVNVVSGIVIRSLGLDSDLAECRNIVRRGKDIQL